MRFVVDGQDLLDYLRHEGIYADGTIEARRPGIILAGSQHAQEGRA